MVIYLDNIMVYSNNHYQVLNDMLELIRTLAIARFMINLGKKQLVEWAAKALWHHWMSRRY